MPKFLSPRTLSLWTLALAPPAARVAHFDYNTDGLLSADVDMLTTHAKYLLAHPERHARIEGHTDARGTQEFNMAMGERRAQAVVWFLKS